MYDSSMPSRKNLGHTDVMGLKLHPDLSAHIRTRAEATYCSNQEYLRKLIVADMERSERKRLIAALNACVADSGCNEDGTYFMHSSREAERLLVELERPNA